MQSPIDALHESTEIARATVQVWMSATDLRIRAETYVLTGKAWDRITPELSGEQQCTFTAGYLLDCVERDVRDDDYIHNGFEAAWELARWIKHVVNIPGIERFVTSVVSRLEELFTAGDEKLRNRIAVGVLEHALESPELRPYFAHWSKAPGLAEDYRMALEWGVAHEGGT